MKKKLALSIALGLGITYTVAPTSTFAKESYQSQLNSIQAQKDSQLSQKEQVVTKENQLQSEIDRIGQQVLDMTGKISQKQVEYNTTQSNIDKLKSEIDATKKRMAIREQYFKERAKSYYMNGNTSYLDVLMGSSSFGDLIQRAYAMKEISANDQKVINQQKQDKVKLESSKAQVEKDLKATATQLDDLKTMLSQIQSMQEQKKQAADLLNKKASNISDRLANLNAAEKSITQAQLDEAARQAAAKTAAESAAQLAAPVNNATVADNSASTTTNNQSSSASSDNQSSSSSNNQSSSASANQSASSDSQASTGHTSSPSQAAPVSHQSSNDSSSSSILLPQSTATGGVSGIIHAGDKYLNGNSTYVWGGGRTAADVAAGRFDCSGFVYWAFRSNGIMLGGQAYGSTHTLDKVGENISSKSDLRPGDLVFFNTEGYDTHVGIYIGGGQWIGSNSSYGIQIKSINDIYYWGSKFSHGQRVLG